MTSDCSTKIDVRHVFILRLRPQATMAAGRHAGSHRFFPGHDRHPHLPRGHQVRLVSDRGHHFHRFTLPRLRKIVL